MNPNALVSLQMGAGQMGGSGMGPGGWGFGYGFVGLAVMLLFLGAIGYVLVRAFSESGRANGRGETAHARGRTTRDAQRRTTNDLGGRTTNYDDPALAELRERYARGDIDDEEFERRAERLRDDSNAD